MRGFTSIAAAGAMLAGAALFTAAPAFAHQDGDGKKDMDHQHMNQKSESMEGHSHEMAEIHGGEVTMTPHHHFEALFLTDGVRLYAYDENQKPIMDLKGVKGKLTLQSKDGKSQSVKLDLLPPDEKAGRTQPCLAASHDFADMKPGMMKATFEVQGVTKDPIEFKTPVTISPETLYTCSMHPDVRAEDPGECPECGMKLTPMETESGHGHDSGDMHDAHEGMKSGGNR
jgi:hypothetical protein